MENDFNDRVISDFFWFKDICGMLYNVEQQKPLSCFFYLGWPLRVDIMKINLFSNRRLIHVIIDVIFIHATASGFSFHS